MFERLGRFIVRRRRRVLAAWVAIIVVGGVLGSAAVAQLDPEFEGSDRLESVRVDDAVRELTHAGPEVVGLFEGASDETLADIATEARAVPGVISVIDPTMGIEALRSTDGRSGIVVATVDDALDPDEEREVGEELTDLFRSVEGNGAEDVGIGGTLPMFEEFREQAEKDLQRGEMIALPIALVAMVIIFGGIVAAGLPLAVALGGVAGSMFVLYAASSTMSVSIFALNIITMLGLGLGIDYGLLVVSRFREERAAGRLIDDAVIATTKTAGTTVAFSALTVAVALGGLFAFGDNTFNSFGIAGIGVVLAALAAGVTLLPALLATFGHRIKPAKSATADHGAFHRIATIVQRRAIPVVAIVGIGLVLLATPFLGANVEAGDARALPRSSEVRATALQLEEEFPARGANPVVVVAEADAGSPEVAELVRRFEAIDGVNAVALRQGVPAGTAIIDIVPHGTSQGDEAQHIVHAVRDMDLPVPVEVGGDAGWLIDFKGLITDRLPYALGVIAIATFALLFLMTGSIAVPIKAIVMNVLSLGATFGAMVWVFQDGHLSDVLAFDPVGSIDLYMPVLIFIFAFGLSMDYEVFLLSRIKEVHDQTGDNDRAVSVGLQRSGRIITSAALLIVVVFAGFAAGEVLTIKQLGLGLAIAVVVDATIVRSLLVPATMKLLGEWNWWAPGPMRRFHERYGLHEAPSTVVDLTDELERELVDA